MMCLLIVCVLRHVPVWVDTSPHLEPRCMHAPPVSFTAFNGGCAASDSTIQFVVWHVPPHLEPHLCVVYVDMISCSWSGQYSVVALRTGKNRS